MPPRRSNRVNKEADPAFNATITQAVADLLPTLTARITDEIHQNENNGNNGNRRNSKRGNPGGLGNDGDVQPTNIHVWLERFRKEKPQTFSSASTPVEAENWITHIEKIFEVLGCDDQFKARLATYKLEGDAHSWWRAYKQAKGGDAYVATLSWNDFRDIFFLQYFPYSKKERCEREYKSIRQLPKETSTDFMKRFLRLAGFLGAKAGTQEEQAKHFKWGLNDFVLDRILNTEFTDVAQVANAARNIEIFRDRPKNEGDNKRDRDGHRIRPSYTTIRNTITGFLVMPFGLTNAPSGIMACLKIQPEIIKDLEIMEVELGSSKEDGELRSEICVLTFPSLREAVLTEAHNSPFSIHLGSTKMCRDLKQNFWWNGMKRDVARFVAKCLTFQQVKIEHQRASGLLQPLDILTWK
ncbi:zinc finger, CCHC-type, retrotransposon gag domain protein [Tanacetum coccineum]